MIAPSWSWASIEGPIMVRRCEISQSLIDIVTATTEAASNDSFGQLSGGYLCVRGALFAMPPLWALLDRQPYRSNSSFDEWALGFDDAASLEYEESINAFFIPLALSPDASRAKNLTILGLVLKEIGFDQDQRTFTRVGFAIVDAEDGGIANTGWSLKRWEQLPWDDKNKITITVL
jgi:hypothetical protein